MRNAIKILAAAGLILAAILTTQKARSFATSVLRPAVGTIITCPAAWTNVLTIDGGSYTFGGTATASFETTSVTAASQPAGSKQKLVSLSATATDPVLGTISWKASGSTGTSILANQVATDFPATSDIFFTPTATISSRPGVTYTGTTVHLQTTSLSSFNPQKNESYKLVNGPIKFTSGSRTFTLDLQSFVVN